MANRRLTRLQPNSLVVADGSRERFTEVVDACRAAAAEIWPNGEILFHVEAPVALPVS